MIDVQGGVDEQVTVMMFGSVVLPLAVALALAVPQERPQDPLPTQLEDVIVTAERRADMAKVFVNRIAAPSRGAGLGRWRGVCPGIANLDRGVAQPIADRIAYLAAELGIQVQEPGCEANIIVVFTADATTLTRTLVENDPRVFRNGGNRIDRGTAALRDFVDSGRPVRWWSLSIPIDSETGKRAVRVPGDPSSGPVNPRLARAFGCDNPSDCIAAGVPIIQTTSFSRLNTQIVDQLYKSIVIVDVNAVAGLNTTQLGDYLAMVTLSQVDPEAETGAFETVLNLFDNPTEVSGLTEWDRAYMSALYGSNSRRRSTGAQADAVASIMFRSTQDQQTPDRIAAD